MKKASNVFSQEQLREMLWEIGAKYPIPMSTDYLALYMTCPHQGHLHWHVSEERMHTTRWQGGESYNNAPLIIRMYDVTDVLFDGFNAHEFFDFEVNALRGNYYCHTPKFGRSYIAEIGLRGWDGSFRALARSNHVFFERERPADKYQVSGLFVGGAFQRKFDVENIFDTAVYERMNRELAGIERQEPLSAAIVFLGMNQAALDSPLGVSIKNLPRRIEKFGGTARIFSPLLDSKAGQDDDALLSAIQAVSNTTVKELARVHKTHPFHLLHCHDWYSSKIGIQAAKTLKLPCILSLHSTEYERAHSYEMHGPSSAICEWEREAAQAADLVIVPHSSTRQQVINMYETNPENIVIIADVLTEESPDTGPDTSGVRNWLDIDSNAPIVLFAGEMSHASGADLLVDALPTVGGKHGTAVFVFVGNGQLKGELEGRAAHAGIGHRCRFIGDVPEDTFTALLLTSECVVIPARTWQDEGLAQMAIHHGKPVLATHQSGIQCVKHGENGLFTYDNPGSIIWGVQEMLLNPLGGRMQRMVARNQAGSVQTAENMAAQHYLYYEIVSNSTLSCSNGLCGVHLPRWTPHGMSTSSQDGGYFGKWTPSTET